MPESGRLRVLVVGLSWPPETFLVRLIRGLAAAGVDVLVSSSREARDTWPFEAGVTRVDAPNWSGPVALRLGRLAVMSMRGVVRAGREVRTLLGDGNRSPRLADRLRTWNRLLPFAGVSFDVVYFPWSSAAIDHIALFGLGRPGVISCRGSQVHVAPYDPQRGRLREGLRATFAKAAAVHCVSQATLKEAVGWGLDPSKARVIRPAVNPDFFLPSPSPGSDGGVLEVVTTGSLVGIKGHEYALLAIRKLADRGLSVRFTIIGDGPERGRVEFTIRDLALEQHVRLVGRKTPEEVRAHLQRSHVFLLSSLSEGISNAALEAMACGLPVVTTACGGMTEAVTDGVEGFVVPVRAPASMADALARMASDPSSRRRMGQAARTRVVKEFVLDSQVEQFIHMMEGVTRCAAA